MTWADRGQLVLSPTQALEALDSLPADNPAAEPWGAGGGREGWFGKAWEDVDGNGCDTRNDILGRDLTDTDYSRAPGVQAREAGAGRGASNCPNATVFAGTLNDPYTGEVIAFKRGEKSSAAVQIDHIIPLNYLYAHGAWAWDARTRALAANDPLNLVAVDGPANEAKGNCGPATCPEGSTESGHWVTDGGTGWWPPNEAYRCTYASRFVSVAAAYGLGLPDEDREALRTSLSSCASGGDGSASVGEKIASIDGKDVAATVSSPLVGGALALGALILGGGLLLMVKQRSWQRRMRHR